MSNFKKIFIFALLLGILLPKILFAQDADPQPLGTCTLTFPKDVQMPMFGNTLYDDTNTECTSAQKTYNASSSSWKANGTYRGGIMPTTQCSLPNLLQNGVCKPCPNGTFPAMITAETGYVCSPNTIQPQKNNDAYSGYTYLAPINTSGGGTGNTFDPKQKNALGVYLNIMLKIFIGFLAVMAVVMIVIGGIEYMTSELIGNKEAGKDRIMGALFGLVIALSSYALLNTINPDLLNTEVKLDPTTIAYEADQPQTYDAKTNKYLNGSTYGHPWDDTVGKFPDGLPPNTHVFNNECTSTGQQHCTSTRGLSTTSLVTIENGCKCDLAITGGTEFWLHGGKTGNTSHMLNSATVDLAINPDLTKYIAGTQPLVYYQRYSNGDGLTYLYEGDHWHVGP